MAKRSVLFVPPGVVTKTRPSVSISRLEALPLEILHRIVEHSDVMSRVDLSLCSSFLMLSVKHHGYLDFEEAMPSTWDDALIAYATIMPSIHFTIHPPQLSHNTSADKHWISPASCVKCDHCPFAISSPDWRHETRPDQFNNWQLMAHFAAEASARGSFFPKWLAIHALKAVTIKALEYLGRLGSVSFLTLRIPELGKKLEQMKAEAEKAKVLDNNKDSATADVMDNETGNGPTNSSTAATSEPDSSSQSIQMV